MPFSAPIERFITRFAKIIRDGDAAIFAGAVLSVAAGYVNWTGLFEEAAKEIGLDVTKEPDLISLAQYIINTAGHKTKIQQLIIENFPLEKKPTINHTILARLPIKSLWTTNYDTLIEDALRQNGKIVDVKHQAAQLSYTSLNRGVTVYKMHGDSQHPHEAILTKEEYEKYYKTHPVFLTAL